MEERHVKLVEREIRRINRLFCEDQLRVEFRMINYDNVCDFGYTPMYIAEVKPFHFVECIHGGIIDILSTFCHRNFMSYQMRLKNGLMYIEIT